MESKQETCHTFLEIRGQLHGEWNMRCMRRASNDMLKEGDAGQRLWGKGGEGNTRENIQQNLHWRGSGTQFVTRDILDTRMHSTLQDVARAQVDGAEAHAHCGLRVFLVCYRCAWRRRRKFGKTRHRGSHGRNGVFAGIHFVGYSTSSVKGGLECVRLGGLGCTAAL